VKVIWKFITVSKSSPKDRLATITAAAASFLRAGTLLHIPAAAVAAAAAAARKASPAGRFMLPTGLAAVA
jgi:hypothetical protein